MRSVLFRVVHFKWKSEIPLSIPGQIRKDFTIILRYACFCDRSFDNIEYH